MCVCESLAIKPTHRVEKSREEERREGREQKRTGTGTKEAHSSLRLVMYWVSNNR